MQDKIVLITGATNGIGKAAALALAKLGAVVVIVGRSPTRTEAVMREIAVKAHSKHVESFIADLSSPAEVRRLAEEFKRNYSRLDVLINNAGAIFSKRQETPDGLEMTFALNHLSYFLMTNLLIDELRSAAKAEGKPARVVNVSSGAHFAATLDFDNLQNKRLYNGWRAYAASKLANVLFTYELARRVNVGEIVANAVHPGTVATGFAREGFGLTNLFFALARPFLLSPEQGADTPVYLATAPEVEGVTGKYFQERRSLKSSFVSYDETTARRLWDASVQLTGLSAQTAL
jgi:NAD(P)-dependent dehydrogenase (short-subunit alcohol dehydrogenase family)